MFRRQTRSKLPTTSTTPSHNQQTLYDLTKLTDSFQKQKMKNYADNKNSKPSNINIGDTVIVKQNKTNKQTPPFDPKPYVVTDMKGSMITASRGNTDKTRNSSHFKKVPPYIPIADQDFHEEMESDPDLQI